MTLPQLVQLRPVRRSPLSSSQQVALNRALGIPTPRRWPLHFPFAWPNPQIDTPQRLAPVVLQPFVEQRTFLRLVHPELRSLPAVLTAFDEHALQVTVPLPSRLLPYTHQRVLVVFPMPLQPSYVLPTCLAAIGGERITLQYQDPRQDLRRRIPGVGVLTVHLAPPSVLAAMEHHHMRLTRVLSWRPGRAGATLKGELMDLVEAQPVAPVAYVDFFSTTPTWHGYLHNISRSGVCLLLPPDFRGHTVVHHVVLLRLRLPPVKLTARSETVALTLRVLGTVRAVRMLQRDVALHVRLLDRLPEAFEGIFARLEQGHRASHYPVRETEAKR